MISFIVLIGFLCLILQSNAFSVGSSSLSKYARSKISMEYIPDGLTKKEWEQVKAREAEELKRKGNMGIMGVNRFKSRSLQAWQEAGAKHLFPVNPNTSKYEERPYMQRRGGDWEGSDLKKKGLQGADQGKPVKRLDVDDRYDDYGSQGLLNSVNIFGRGPPLPWTSESANAMSKSSFNPEGKQGTRGVAGKKLSPEEIAKLKAQLVKPIISNKEPVESSSSGSKKMFGLF